ncbi:MAG: ATP-binding cassette domain-containing protein [Planctomycetia bacterium]|nr:ATP-binding cassette domain-containing protein [Planctomycetia bacterium]
MKLLQVKNLKTYFPIRRGLFQHTVGYVQAVDDVSFSLEEGETLGLVGESGCGKTTTGRSVLQLIPPTEGEVWFQGKNIVGLSEKGLKPIRRNMQIVFQDPYGSMNPRMTIRAIVEEGLIVQNEGNARERYEKVRDVIHKVGLEDSCLDRYPHEFSGGQRQRVCIARALVLNPKFIVLDEPISALDVSIQSQIINLLVKLRGEMGLAFLFISHDLSVVEYLSDRVAVMYLGQIIETAKSSTLYARPAHPYTRALLSSIPTMDAERRQKRILLHGDVPSPVNPPKYCRFCPRCPKAQAICREVPPPLVEIGAGHTVRCHFPEGESNAGEHPC